MLLECAVGDAYGAGFEFNETAYVANKNDLSSYVKHHGHPGLKPGMYTDDTQMSIALAELMLEEEENWTPENICQKFVECFKRDERRGYSGRFYYFLKSIHDGKEFIENIMPVSDRSGSAMRAAVVGLYDDLTKVYKATHLQASMTHATDDGIAAALAVSYTSHYFYHQLGSKNNLLLWLDERLKTTWKHPWGHWKGKAGVNGIQCVRAAHTAILEHNKMTDILKAAVAFKGDVDTVAAIAMSCASVCQEIEQDLPQHLIDNLENGTYGKDYLKSLDHKLSVKY